VGLGLDRAGRGQRGLRLTTVGWLALVVAASGWLLIWLRANAMALGLWIFCDWTSDCSAILWSNAPFYLATLGLVAPVVPISLILHHRRLGSHLLRIATFVTGSVAVIVLVLAIIAAYDSMWSNYVGPFGLDVPRRPELLTADLRLTSWLAWPAFLGAWIALTSLQLRRAIPTAIATLGVTAGVAAILSAPFAWDGFSAEVVVPLDLIVSLVWATAVGVYLMRAKRAMATA